MNRYPQNSLLLAGATHAPDHSVARIPASEAMAAGWIATVVSLLCAGVDVGELADSILHFDTISQTVTRSRIVRRGDCPDCSPAGIQRAPLTHFQSRYTGLLRDVKTDRVAGFYAGLGYCIQSYPRDRRVPIVAPQAVLGKGETLEEAMNACLGEAVERYSLAYQGVEKTVVATLGGIDGIPLNDLLCCSERQYEERREEVDDFVWVPPRFREDAVVPWVVVTPLSETEPKYVLAEYAYFWASGKDEARNCIADSNGCACGPSLAAAQLSGLLELIERDAASIWWYNRLQRPALEVESISDWRLRATLSRIEDDGWNVSLLDITTDLGVPVYACSLRHEASGRFSFGTAAHLDPVVAATKAAAEAALSEFAARNGDGQTRFGEWLSSISPATHPQFVPSGICTLPVRTGYNGVQSGLRELVATLSRKGIHSYFLDLTRPETGWPVVRVLAPGLRHFMPRFAPGRLFDVPVSMGWLEKPRREEEMEQTPLAL